LKANVSLLHFSWKAVPQLRTCSYKTPVSIVAVGSSHNARPWYGRSQLMTTFVGDKLATMWTGITISVQDLLSWLPSYQDMDISALSIVAWPARCASVFIGWQPMEDARSCCSYHMNSLPDSLKDITPSLSCCQNQLKTFFFVSLLTHWAF